MPPVITDVQTTYNLFCADIGLNENTAPSLIGKVSAFKPPAFVERMYNPPALAGFTYEIPIGWEMFEATFTVTAFVEKLAGYYGLRNTGGVGYIWTFKQALESAEPQANLVTHTIAGHLKSYDQQESPP